MSEIRVNNLSNESNTGGPSISGITTFSSPYFFIPPVGSTAERPDNPQKGELRFNTDSKHLEYFKGDTIGWAEVEASNDELNGGNRGVFMGGSADGAGVFNTIDYITISTLGNATDFGDFSSTRQEGGGFGSPTRGFHFGGDPALNIIEYVTFSSTGNPTDFGDTTGDQSKHGIGGADRTRGIMYLGWANPARVNNIEYITTASTGNAVDFGDATDECYDGAGMTSSTRMVSALGSNDAGAWTNAMDYITIQTKGNAADFGDQIGTYNASCGYSNAVRGVLHGAYQYPTSPNHMNLIQYITIATLGNAQDFGDSTHADQGAGCSSSTRGISAGGYNVSPGVEVNTIDYIQIMTLGNALDFGDLTVVRRHVQGASNGHGGL